MKSKKGKIKNSKDEEAVDFVAVKEGGDDYHVKTLEVESDTTLEADKGSGAPITLRFFDFAANPETFKQEPPTLQQLFQSHIKQIQIELWKDEWQPIYEIEPRFLFSEDKSHYRIVVAARPAKGSMLSNQFAPQTLTELAHGNTPKNSD